MAQVQNSENRFGGQYMVQDHDHMSEIDASHGAQRGSARQADQSRGQQQASGDQNATGQQGGERNRKTR